MNLASHKMARWFLYGYLTMLGKEVWWDALIDETESGLYQPARVKPREVWNLIQ